MTLLITQRRSTIGVMSCNPSIGGVGKGHIVREIDVFDGIMGRAADDAAIHHRLLNASKGAAVQGPRVQADRQWYRASVQRQLDETPMLRVIEEEVDRLVLRGGAVVGVELAGGETIAAPAVVIATGTFLGARLFRGRDSEPGGRLGDRPAARLAEQLRTDGAAAVGRLKTGTPPRLDGRTIDWARLERQPSDDGDWTMSMHRRDRPRLPQVDCAITRTTAASHAVVREALLESPMFLGMIEGRGPRYCPSIEDKVARFGDRDGHQIFLEPEGLATTSVYPNGISTSLSAAAQTALVATIPGLERATIEAFGYAVEYDFLDPRDLDRRLESRSMPGLFRAGQINGTTGYEEAAGQGLVAGLNAAALVTGRAPVLLDRASSYIGVMIDDLVLQGVTEPYRMLTARAEYRLALRADNAETRLGEQAIDAGCLTDDGRATLDRRERLRRDLIDARTAGKPLVGPADIIDEVVATLHYAPYVERQRGEVEQMRRAESVPLDTTIDYRRVVGLSHEMIERLDASRPTTLGEAGRLRGVTPAALTAILLHVRRRAA